MINLLAKSLVLLHTILSLAGMTWAIMIVLQAKDFGWKEPYKEVLEYTKEGGEKSSVRHASTFDKSQAALIEAVKTRDLTYSYVKPALDSLRFTEPYLPSNQLFYLAELKRLREAPDKIDVKRLQDVGMRVEDNTRNLGKPVAEVEALKNIDKSYKAYQGDLKTLYKQIDDVEDDIRKIVNETKKITADLTGTDETNKYVQPGLYNLIDLEYKAQGQIKTEMEDIKPKRSKAVENARLFQYTRAGLEEALDRLKGIAPAPKDQKK
jgi:hypothetical protein